MTIQDSRPSPDQMLARASAEEARASRGRLKIFFGFAPGVGKTFSMLEEARARRNEGLDVVGGVIETHKRAETEALLAGLEMLPRREVAYHGVTLHEFDIDAALARRPAIILVDELAHTNAHGSRHAKRWQDVEELLRAGINVYTTVNVQHIESLSDVVSQITGIVVRETIPDSLLEMADELELVDLPPEDLLQRLAEGKVYLPEQAGRAAQNFFRKGNLIALRELSLRRTADRVSAQMVNYRRDQSIQPVWHTSDRLLVAVGPSPYSARLIRAVKRMAESQHAEWFAISIETPEHAQLGTEGRDRIAENLQLAERLGGQTATVPGERTSAAILGFAREHNITRIVVGKPLRRRLKERLFGTIVDELIRECGDIDIYVITGEGDAAKRLPERSSGRVGAWKDWAWAAGAVAIATAIAALMIQHFAPANLIMIYLLAVVIIAVRRGRSASIIATCLSVAAFDFFFVPPRLTFAVSDSEYFVTFAVMLGVGLLISDLAARTRTQAESAAIRERTTRALFELSQGLVLAAERAEIVRIATDHAGRILEGIASVLIPNPAGRILDAGESSAIENERSRDVAQWVLDHGEPAGMGTDTLAGSDALYLPIAAAKERLGVLKLKPRVPFGTLDPERLRFMSTVSSQIAQALERERLTWQAQSAKTQVEAEKMRNLLLSSVSHDLRTPLTVIAGAASSLGDEQRSLDEPTKREFARTIYEESRRLDRLVSNLLEMSRLESGSLRPNREWHVLEEVVGVALNRLDTQLDGREVTVAVAPDMPLVQLDDLLMEQVFTNLLENALKHTPAGTPIEIAARRNGGEVLIELSDRGPGLPPGEEDRIFEKFHQAGDTRGRRGVGLGLAICRSLVEAHGGRIWAANREGGGAVFSFTLPLDESARGMAESILSEGES